jgi:hypothetical protein
MKCVLFVVLSLSQPIPMREYIFKKWYTLEIFKEETDNTQ